MRPARPAFPQRADCAPRQSSGERRPGDPGRSSDRT